MVRDLLPYWRAMSREWRLELAKKSNVLPETRRGKQDIRYDTLKTEPYFTCLAFSKTSKVNELLTQHGYRRDAGRSLFT